MSSKLSLKESELISLVRNVLKERREHSEMDYFDAFFKLFWGWIKKNVDEKYWSYPTGFLLKKYSIPFVDDVAPDFRGNHQDSDEWYIDRWDLQRIVDTAIANGNFSMPNLQSEEKFTEKYKKVIPSLIEYLNLPKYVHLKITEDEPHYVKIFPSLMYANMLLSDEARPIDSRRIEKKISEFLKNYLGVDLGNPVYGETQIDVMNPEMIGLDEWVKDVLNKQIKKHIRQFPSAKNIKSIRYEPRTNGADMKIVFKDWPNYEIKNKLRDDIKKYFEELGIGDKIRIEF